MMISCTKCKIRHDSDSLQNLISVCSVLLHDSKLVICKFSRFVQDIDRCTYLTNIMKKRYSMDILQFITRITHLCGKHFSILRNSEGVTVGILILNVNAHSKSLDHLVDELSVLFLFLQECFCTLSCIRRSHESYKKDNQG